MWLTRAGRDEEEAEAPRRTRRSIAASDANGQSHFGQSIPAVCIGRDIEVLDNTGRVVRRIDSTAALAARAGQQDQADAEKRAAEAAAQRDRTLLATYLSVADIERLRDNRLEILVQQSAVTREYISNLRERETRLIADVQRFRPYSPKPNAPAVPDHLAEEMVNTVNGPAGLPGRAGEEHDRADAFARRIRCGHRPLQGTEGTSS